MGKKIATNVVGIHEKTGETRWFRKGDAVPKEYQASITNPAAYEQEGEPALAVVPDPEPEPEEDLLGPEPEPEEEADEEPEDNYEDPDFTNDDLRAELARRDLPVHGNKPDLIARLRESDAETA